jgi:hypothetical protein
MVTPFLTGSYLTVEEFKAAPTALSTQNLVPGGNQAQQDAQLSGLIGRASRWIDSIARQPLYATQATQTEQARIKNGDAVLHAHQDHVKTVSSFAYGPNWTSLTVLTNPLVFIEENRVRVRVNGSGSPWIGNLSNLNWQTTGGTVFAQWTFIAGWVTTRLTNLQNIGDLTVTVDNPAGVIPGTQLRFTAGSVQNTYIAASVAGNVITLASPLIESWPSQAGVSETPDDLKEACILATSHYIKQRSGTGIIMAKVPSENKPTKDEIGEDLDQAAAIVERYERLAT